MYDCEVVRRESEARATLKGFLRIRGCSWVDGRKGRKRRGLRSRLDFFDEVFSWLQSPLAGTDRARQAVSRASQCASAEVPPYSLPLQTGGTSSDGA